MSHFLIQFTSDVKKKKKSSQSKTVQGYYKIETNNKFNKKI